MSRGKPWRAIAAERGKLWEKQNRPPEGAAWFWMTDEMVQSPAWCALSHAALVAIFRLLIEHMAHGGAENGRLIVTFDQFEAFGLRRKSIGPALREAEALGWIVTTRKGRGGNADFRKASTYALGWLPRVGAQGPRGEDLAGELSDQRWRSFADLEACRRAVDGAEGRWRKTRQQRAARDASSEI